MRGIRDEDKCRHDEGDACRENEGGSSLLFERLGQVSEFKYLGTIFSEDGKLVKEFEERRRKRNAVASQLRSHVFNKKALSSDTKLAIHRSIFRPTILYGS